MNEIKREIKDEEDKASSSIKIEEKYVPATATKLECDEILNPAR